MWPVAFRHLLGLSSAFCIGWAIRLLDDALDQEVDQAVGRPNLGHELGGGTTAYALASMALAVVASPNVALSLFAAAYSIGMAADARLLPTHLPAWLEGAALLGLVMLRTGFRMTLAGWLIMLAVQAIDNWRDRHMDRGSAQRSIMRMLGGEGVWLVAITAACLACYLQPTLAAYSLPVFLYFQWREQAVSKTC